MAGVKKSRYYYWRKHGEPKKAVGGGRRMLGYSWTEQEKRIPDDQIKEYIMEIIANEETHLYGCRKISMFLRQEHGIILNKKRHIACAKNGVS
jgi:putative transposase